ncbi:MAG: starch-binding protein, partial [Prevotella sp.]|nr:starch-binding protein [Prevotella sp.]
LGEWPGTQLTAENGVYTVAIQAEEAPKFIIFHNNAGDQTPDWTFEDGKAYEYNLNEYTATFTTDAEWTDIYAYAWTSSETAVKEFVGPWPGIKLEKSATNDAYAFSVKAFNAPNNILFNNGTDEGKTADLPFIDGKAYKWIIATPFYALKEGDTFPAGTTVDLTDATITYGVEGGADFGAASAAVNEDYAGFEYMTAGNGENGGAETGTVYTIVPKYNGTITIGVRLNGGKKMHINEDGTDMADYAGITITDAANTTFSFDVKAGSTYKIWCDGSKLGFFGFDYKYEAQTTDVTFNFADPNIRENIGENMADTKGWIYNETFTAEGTTLQIIAGSAPSRIYKDANHGQNLVTYKEYTTLTFRAPEGKAITKIEFTAAGNSNINNFTASSGTIKDMTWTGNADGVRFQQGGTSYLANAVVTLEAVSATTEQLAAIEYVECPSIAAFNALEAGTYAKVTLTDAEVIGKSADGYSTVFIQDATGGCWIQYTSLNDKLSENTKVNGTIYTIKRVASGNTQMKEAEGTLNSEINAEKISDYTVIEGSTIAAVNTAENLNRVVKLTGATLEETSATAGKLTIGEETIDVNNGTETANQQLHKIADWANGTKMEDVTIVAILVAKSATANQLLPISIEGVTVGISTVNAATAQETTIYNMAGQRVMSAQKGLYIVNGKKVVVK